MELVKQDFIGFGIDVFFLDIGIGELEMFWIVVLYISIVRYFDIYVYVCIVGKFISQGIIYVCIFVFSCGIFY